MHFDDVRRGSGGASGSACSGGRCRFANHSRHRQHCDQCRLHTGVLGYLYRQQQKDGIELVTKAAATLQDLSAVSVWIVFIVFLELVHAFGKGENVPSWAYVIAGFLRAHRLLNLLTNGLALHPQPRTFLLGVLLLLAARACSHFLWQEHAAAGELVTMRSAQCGSTEEWMPRGLFQIVLMLVMTTFAYINRQLMERAAVRELASAVGLRRRALEISSSLLPPHVIPMLEQRGLRNSLSSGNLFGLAEKHSSVICLFADVVGFTSKCARVQSQEVFMSISKLFNALDDLCREFQLTKIETIGDAYWCSHGLESPATPADACKMLRFATAMRRVVGNFKIGGEALAVRIGIHVGPMLGGIVGSRFPRYHLFGPHAKLAAVLEQAGEPTVPLVSDAFRRLLMQAEEDWGTHIPAEVGPIVFERDARGTPLVGVKLQRHEGIEAQALVGLDQGVAAHVDPCWLVYDLVDSVKEAGIDERGAV